MGSSGKTRTTYAKLNRESRLRDKRVEKEARKAARKLDAAGEATDSGPRPEELGGAPVEPVTWVSDSPQEGNAESVPAASDGGI